MTDVISRQAAIEALYHVDEYNGRSVEAIRKLLPAQPTPDQNGDLWITVPDIDKVTRIYVQESKSKFCRIFYEEQEQPERIKGRWIESNGLNILMKKFIEKGETWRVCDKCGAGFMIGYQYECDKLYHETFHNFCPNCGADMREEKEK